ncbi:hypothetical protein OG413_15675 [Streptomyces sp. NBC_01433]|uniref:hypothetical protein n=1 Tax=unclassified Streptomyces TaxID=2593676 RepID=UPI00225331D2|nr:hypothetical protein [Streptomyces sp. NBC_01433]MCX4676724.1 hypothetical protein [Streptomyces sp. NBC_01433]
MDQQAEEVTRLKEAIAALEAMSDDAACTAAVSDVLREWPQFHARLRELRQRRVRALRDDEGKTWPEIANIIGQVTPARAQQIGKGLRGDKRPPKKSGSTPAE